MKPVKAVAPLLAAAFLLPAGSVFAEFTGYFAGYYAPPNWTNSVYGNTTFRSSAIVNSSGAPGSVTINGAYDFLAQVSSPQLPVSGLDYSIVLSGSGLQPVSFSYAFTGAADGYDSAALLYDGNVVATLSGAVDGSVHTFSDTTDFQGGHIIGFRVLSNNDNFPDTLTITPIPEPSAISLALLGAGMLVGLWRRAR